MGSKDNEVDGGRPSHTDTPPESTDPVADPLFDSRLQKCPIAIVGIASIFADAKNVDEYWDLIIDSIDPIKDIPASRWNIDDYYSSNKDAADKVYCKRGGFLPDIDFDPMEFGLPPNILEVTDIAQLLSLVVARDVLNDAGIGEDSGYDRDKVGIVLGVSSGQKLLSPLMSRLQGPVLNKVLEASGIDAADREVIVDKFKKAFIGWEENSFPGLLSNVIAGRVANRFNLGGTNCVVDAACAASLAAIKLAISDLLEHRSEVMISGGVCCDNSPFMYMSFSKTPAFTTGQNIRPFDNDSMGMMIGEGVGMMAFKRLEDAERDGDRIYAVLKGIGTSSDGRFKSIYAPRSDGQAKALRRAYRDAGFEPLSCGLIEAHGTGTRAGDMAEFAGLKTVFGENNSQGQHIALGSVKSQVGHTKAAAGTAGMIKAALSLYHKILPATINVDKPNEALGIDDSPFYLNTETRPWMPRVDGTPRRAGVSSFGFGGTNFHMVLEEYQPRQQDRYRIHSVPQTVLLAADSEGDLVALLKNWHARLNVADDRRPYAFNALVTECGLKTPGAELARVGFVAKNAGEAAELIELAIAQLTSNPGVDRWSHPAGIFYGSHGMSIDGKVVALFPGQGSQYVNMGRESVYNFPLIMETASAMDGAFASLAGYSLSTFTYPNPVFSDDLRRQQEESLRLTQHAQPAIGALSAGLYELFSRAGFKADYIAGHSFGELTALWAAGVLERNDFMTLACERGQAMAARDDQTGDAGSMIAVVGDPEAVTAEIEDIADITIANYNSGSQSVVAGPGDRIVMAARKLKDQGYKVIELPVSAAFHTPLVGHAQKPFAKAINRAAFKAPKIAVYSNSTGKRYPKNIAEIKKRLKNHILEPVRFKDEIDSIYADGGRVFVEFGPKNVLTRLVEDILKEKHDVTTIAINANPKKSSDIQLRLAAIQLAVIGMELQDIDPYSAVERPLEVPELSPLSMKISGASYVSDKTRKDFEDALNDGWTVKQAKQKTTVVAKPKVIEKIVEVEKVVHVADDKGAGSAAVAQKELISSIERSVSQLVEHQQKLLDVHKQYVEGPNEYFNTVQAFLSAQGDKAELPEGLDRTLEMYHKFQSDTLKVHEQFLNSQAGMMSSLLDVGGSSCSMDLAVEKTSDPIPPAIADPEESQLEVTPAVIAKPVVAEPADQRVATAGMEAVVPLREAVVPLRRERRSDTSSAFGARGVNVRRVSEVVAEPAPASPAMEQPAPAGLAVEALQSVVLSVVSEKTGYPSEMLKLDMDMESDLGIDSIKRVEILGAVQDALPGLPELKPEDLAELRSLGEIVSYMQRQSGAAAGSAPVAEVSGTGPAAEQPAGRSVEELQSVVLSVVSEKTGYPSEMLKLDMDMESDLGIDSIKRVEILGAVQDALPGLPELKPEDLAELRSLDEIVSYMQRQYATATIHVQETDNTLSAVERGPSPNLENVPYASVALSVLGSVTQTDVDFGDQHVLIVDDGGGCAQALSGALLKQGARVTVLTPKWIKAGSRKKYEAAVRTCGIERADEVSVSSLLEELEPIDSVIYWQPKLANEAGLGSLSDSEGLAKHSLDLAFLLAKYCNVKMSNAVRPAFLVVTRQGGTLGYTDASVKPVLSADLVQSGLSGLVKTLSHEWDNVFCRLVDLSARLAAAKSADVILSELGDINTTLVEVAHDTDNLSGKGKRLTLVAEQSDISSLNPGGSIDKNSVFLVSGGAKGVTAHCAIRLAEAYQSRFILLGRSAYSETEPDWAGEAADEVQLKKQAMQFLIDSGDTPTPVQVSALIKPVLDRREIAHTLESIRNAGGEVRYVKADVTDAGSVKAAIQPAVEALGEITGIIHGAGVLADAYIEQKTLEQFDAVYKTKVEGLTSLLACVEPKTIQHLVLFSSAAGFFGNPGQADYAIANEILNKSAFRLKALYPRARILAMNWGPWDGGMVTPQLKRMFDERGVYIIPLDVGAELLIREMAAEDGGCPQVLVGNDLSRENSGGPTSKKP